VCSDGGPRAHPSYAPGGREEYRICFVADPDGYRIELIDGGSFPTPQDP
jgi:lactoylglutathione lyase